jgi:S1-C subfamily serine protease
MVKEFLSLQKVSYREVDVSRDRAAAEEMVSRTGQSGVPVTVINGETIIGFDRVRLQNIIHQSQTTKRPSFGASVADAAGRSQAGVPGAYIGNIKTGSAAHRLGLVPGDIITGVNKQTVASAADLGHVVAGLGAGSRVTVVFLRDGQKKAAEGVL